MKALLFAALAVLSFASAAEIEKLSDEDLKLIDKPYKALTETERVRRREVMRLNNLIKNGGEMPYPGTPVGTIRYVNLQKRVASDDLRRALGVFGVMMQYDVAIVDADCEATLKIKIVDDADQPTLLVAPEERWAQINVAKLGDEKTKAPFLAARTRKEMIRAFAFLTAGSQSDLPMFTPIRNPSDFDQFAEHGFPVDIIMRSKNYLSRLGVEPLERATYRSVLLDGFDVAPTNDYQKAIYEEVRKTVKLTKKVK